MDIRKEYLEFFKSKKHEIFPSAPLVPDDATLLFTNAGMVPFKNIFTGAVPRPTPPRRTTCQTSMRAGGKHNDLENVGFTARHHTFFEMLGNFSFGDYFKEQAITYAWEFVTERLCLPADKLYVTTHEKDDEAYEFWKKFVKEDHIYRFGDKDNFWAMGDTGPCGPCSEIFFDQGDKYFKGKEDCMGGDGDRFLEIWNLVFMQFEKSMSGDIKPLPKPSIDTGMGLERVTAIKEGVFSNYDSSLFMPIIDEISNLSGKKYNYDDGAGFRVIADHIRSVTFLLAQGVNFDREGRGYVLRRILRRAVRHGYLLGFKKPFMHKLVDILVKLMGEHYEYLKDRKEAVKELILLEEERFYATLSSGISLFNEELEKTDKIFSGEVAFKLYDTYGFPFDLTQDMLKDKNLKADEKKFDELMNEQKVRAKASWKGSGDEIINKGDFKELLEKFGENNFIGYETSNCESKILAILNNDFKKIDTLVAGNNGWIMLENTPFYATSGGQSCDTGFINTNAVLQTQKFYGLNLSQIEANVSLKIGDIVKCEVSEDRKEIARHHSATHLLHFALRKILGENVSQAGSLVEKNRLRFDFSYPKALTYEQLEKIENIINSMICKGGQRKIEIMDINEAKKSGAIALFGEKYSSKVRVLTLGESKELCGGIHVENINEIGSFFITKESGVSAGVRRIEAVVSLAAYDYAKKFRQNFSEICEILKTNEPKIAIKKLKDENKDLEKQLSKISSNTKINFVEISGVKVAVCEFSGDIKEKIDEVKNKLEKVVILLIKNDDGKISLASGVKNANVKAGEIVKFAAKILGGGGGGRDDFATAGGKDVSKIKTVLKDSFKFIKEKIS